MARQKVPLIILGGRVRKPPKLPPGSGDRHPLSGCKGIDIRLAGRTLIAHLLERLRNSGAFEPIFVAGPADAYSDSEVEVIDTDAGFGQNIQTAMQAVVGRLPGSKVAVTTCDILPEVSELEALVDDYWQTAPSDLWFPLIVAGEERQLGASSWKPKYRVVPEPGQEAVTVLPSHLTIVDPESLRLGFMYRLFDLAYRTRNRPIRYRRSYILRHVMWSLIVQDLLHLVERRWPTLTFDVVTSSMRTGNDLRRGIATQAELEDSLRKIFVRRRHRKKFPGRRIRIPLLKALSLARDIDTVEEAEALGATFA